MQDRTYTPDLRVRQAFGQDQGQLYFIEVKGYFRPERRKLFREMVNSNPDYPVRVILEKNQWVTKGKTKYLDYFQRYLKTVPVIVWGEEYLQDDGSWSLLPEEWI